VFVCEIEAAAEAAHEHHKLTRCCATVSATSKTALPTLVMMMLSPVRNFRVVVTTLRL